MATEWAVVTPKGQYRLGDFPLEVLVELEQATGDEWWNVAAHPFRKAATAQAVYEAACKQLDCTPERLILRQLVDTFEQVEDDLPEVFEGGIPKSEAESQTDGSSGAPNDTDGHQT
jgi:hypothetical protein